MSSTQSAPPLPYTINELVLDARWRVDQAHIGDSVVTVMSFEHPRHGRLNFYMTFPDLEKLETYLREMRESRADAALQWNAGGVT